MAMWQPQRSKQNCLAAWPELTPEGLSVAPRPLLQGFPTGPSHAVNRQCRPRPGFGLVSTPQLKALIGRNPSAIRQGGWECQKKLLDVCKLPSPTKLEREPEIRGRGSRMWRREEDGGGMGRGPR